MAQHSEGKEHRQTTDQPSSDPSSANVPMVQVEPGKGAIGRYEDLLETSAVATAFSVMSSSRASHAERLEAAKVALDMIGKRQKQTAQATPAGITLQLVAPVQSAFMGLADVATLLGRGSNKVADAESVVVEQA